MPVYEYSCKNCGKIFSIRLSMAEHEAPNISCPDCMDRRVAQQYTAFYPKTSKKS